VSRLSPSRLSLSRLGRGQLSPSRWGAVLQARSAPAWWAGQQLRRDTWVPEGPFADLAAPALRRLLILHSPKTGGSSLRTMFAEHVPPERTVFASGAHQWTTHSPHDTRAAEVFVGHQFLEPLYRYPDDDWVTVLAVREPLSWWRSWYTWRRGLLQRAGAFSDPISVLSMSEWVDGRSDTELANPQASWLLARTRLMFDSVAARPGRIAALGGALWSSPGAAVDVLSRLLDTVTVLGPTEDLQGIYLRTCTAMEWTPKYTRAERVNTSKQPAPLLQLRPDQQNRLRALNRIDTWLHTRARTAAGLPAA
jgi:hypothetical protein